MHIVIASDSFKGTLTAAQACEAMAEGVRSALREVRITCVPLADGGEVTTDALLRTGGDRKTCSVAGPLADPVEASYGLIDGGRCAVVEMAQAGGLTLVPPERRDVCRASTYGVGQLIAAALGDRPDTLLTGVGGSGTNDLGAGCAQALGVRFFDATGDVLPGGIGGGELDRIARIDTSGMLPALADTRVVILCDVRNPLVGPEGATRTYGPQKGATAAQVELLERNVGRLAVLIERELGVRIFDVPSAGAAGGLAGGLLAFAGAELVSGAETVLEHVGFEAICRSADAILTGEGQLDAQSLSGKTVSAVAKMGQQLRVPVYVLAGRVHLAEADTSTAFAGVAEAPADVQDFDSARTALGETARRMAAVWFGRR